VADLLREHHAAGRLDTEEFQERVDRCYAAKTYADLDELVADLPRAEQPHPTWRPRLWPAIAIAGLLIGLIALSHGHLFWLAIPLFFFVGRPLLWRFGGRGFYGCSRRYHGPSGAYL
jgi:hypothetical protein